jgi:hypothetical protein
MGRLFTERLRASESEKLYACLECCTALASSAECVSKVRLIFRGGARGDRVTPHVVLLLSPPSKTGVPAPVRLHALEGPNLEPQAISMPRTRPIDRNDVDFGAQTSAWEAAFRGPLVSVPPPGAPAGGISPPPHPLSPHPPQTAHAPPPP